jgi:hypothetical protein
MDRRARELLNLASEVRSESPVFWDCWYKLFNTVHGTKGPTT